MKINNSSLVLTDGYKLDHRRQYPANTNLVYSNFTARKSRIPDIDSVVFFGLQYFCKQYLHSWKTDFFSKPKKEVVKKYFRRLKGYLGEENAKIIGTEHIEYLHDLGFLPIIIKAVKEGTRVPIGKPCLTIYNTDPKCFWITNYLETILSSVLWRAITSATIADKYKQVFNKYADLTGADKNFVPFQGHDFSFRGIDFEPACVSGGAHLLSFVGTDTIPAIDFLEEYYGADSDKELVGCSVAATEHSVLSLGTAVTSEFEVFKRLITEVYPTGIVSIVSDTFDFWRVITEYLPRLKNEILARDGKVVIRPDSGDPVKIVCGDPQASTEWERKGAIECLWDTFGGTYNKVITDSMEAMQVFEEYKQLDSHIGLIYGDSITLERQEQILSQLADKNFASTNMVFGIGSYTYQYQTRDTFGFAVKATYGEVGGKPYNIFKDPATDTDKMKKSAKGLLRLNKDFTLDQEVSWQEEKGGILQPVFINGELVREQTLSDIRQRLEK